MVFSKIMGLFSKKSQKEISYEDARVLLSKGKKDDRLMLAQQKNIQPEVLYYLAEDKDPEVRRHIAGNPSAPVQADAILSKDDDDQVRSELARKIGRLVPDLDDNARAALRDKTIEVMEELAKDQLPKVRALIAEAIKSADNVPKLLVTKLAKDVEEIVCGPILEYSPLLGEEDLREIIAAGATSAALAAIARREDLTDTLSDDLVQTLDIPAISALLTNSSAQIREDTLDQIISQAESVNDLHRPLALRPQLSIRAVKRIAGFVASALVHAMLEQSTLNEDQAEDILESVRARMAKEEVGEEEEKSLAARAKDFFTRGTLNDDFIMAEVEKGHRELVLHCLALMADLDVDIVRKIILSKSGRAVTALAWRSQLSMRTAYGLQTKLALVPNAQLLLGKDGNKYPIDENELDWHLSYFIDQTD